MHLDRETAKPGQASVCYGCTCRIASLDNPNGICDERRIAGKVGQKTPFHCPNGGNRTIQANQEVNAYIELRKMLGK